MNLHGNITVFINKSKLSAFFLFLFCDEKKADTSSDAIGSANSKFILELA